MGHVLPSGTLIGDRFQIEHPAGSGGMGAVYRARDLNRNVPVALKLLHQGVDGPEDVERFAREAQLLAELHHPNIVAYVAHGETATGQRYLVMQWLDGQDLGQRLAQGPLSLLDALRIIQRAAEALTVAHRQGIVHRDLKPTNLFLPDGDISRLKLLDFGIARRQGRSRAMTRTGTVIGTPEYMAPEQVRGSRELLPATDIFALGCVLYECLGGEPPFIAEHIAAVLVRILFEAPTPLYKRGLRIPEKVTALLDDMLQKSSALRIPDADHLLQRIAALGDLHSLPLDPTMLSEAKPVSTFAENEQALFSLVVAAARTESLATGGTLPATAAVKNQPQRAALLSAVRTLGARADYLVDGVLVVTVPQTDSAQDQATMAARVALLIKEHWHEATVAVTTGRGTTQGTTAIGEVADRAAHFLERHSSGLQAVVSDAGSESVSSISGAIYIDELSARLLGPRFIVVKSDAESVLVSEEREVDESRPLLGKPTPCVGRDSELTTLEASLTSCIEESEPRVVMITAPPGAGKSRLRHEFLRRIEKWSQPLTVLLGRGEMMSAGAPFEILGGAIRRLCGLTGAEPPELQRAKLGERIARHVAASDRERVTLFLGELCNISFAAEENPMLHAAQQDPKVMRDRLGRALLDWLSAECAAAPVLLCLDDLQWGDELTISILDTALRTKPDAPLYILAFGRPEVHTSFPRLWQGHNAQEILLKGLSKKACERLIQQVLGKNVRPEILARMIEQSSGNALFLEELIRSIAEGKSEDQPETVLAMLQARIGRLEQGARRALRAASIFGQAFWQGGVASILGLPAGSATVDEWLASAVSAEFIQQHPSGRFANETEYGFRHAIVREAAYSLLTPADLVTGHRIAGEFLEQSGEGDAAVVAEHFERSGDKQRAARGYLRAAESRLERGNNHGALQKVEKGLACEPAAELLGQLRSVESFALFWLDQYERLGEIAEQALERLRPGSLGWCRALAPAFLTAMLKQNAGRGFEIVSLWLATEPDADARSIFALTILPIQSIIIGLVPLSMLQAIDQKLGSIVALSVATNPAIERYQLAARALTTLYREPRPFTAVTEYRRTLVLSEQAGDEQFDLVIRGGYIDWAWLELGDTENVCQRLAAMTERMEQRQEVLTAILWRYLFARALCESKRASDWDHAEKLVDTLLSHTGGHGWFLVYAQCIKARLALLRGKLREVEPPARAAMQLLTVMPTHVSQCAAVFIRALSGLGEHQEATRIAEQVLAVIAQLGGAGFAEVEFRLAASESFHAAGNLDRARNELAATLDQIQLRADDTTDPFWRTSYLTRNAYCARAMQLARDWNLTHAAQSPSPVQPGT